MPRQLLEIRVCDLCNAEGASLHRIVHNNQSVEIDLCAYHAEPLEELIARFVLASPKAPGYATSPHRCEICKEVLSRRVHAAGHVERKHGYSKEASYAHIRPVGERVMQPLDSPSHQPHRCKVCKRPYVNSSTARRHVEQVHGKPREKAARWVELIT